MSKPQKVVWTKGMFLRPQHFQAQDEYSEHALHFRASVSSFANWGFSRLGVDEASLVNGFFTLRHCEGIFPDGLFFQAPVVDDLPPGRQVDEHFADTRQTHLDVYLAIPESRSSAANYSLSRSGGVAANPYRYSAEPRAAIDVTLGSDEKVIQVAHKSLRLLFDDENLDGFTTVRVARIQRSPAGTYILSPEFVPPIIDIAASDYLLSVTRRLIEKMNAKADLRSLSRRQKTGDLADFTNAEAADFWFLHTVNSSLPELNHIWKVRRGHPEILFRAMLRLAGALTTFAFNQSVRDLPDYDHNALGESLTALDARIRDLLDIGRQVKIIATPLRPVERFIWAGALADERQLEATQFIISVSSPVAVDELISKFPRLAKISSSEELSRLIRSSLPGVPLRHLQSLPTAVPLNLSCQYFSLANTGPLWENVLRARALSVFVPGEIADPKMELITVLS
ncbi:MAG TPA: type VI secretion system baseplate subunit TssK [Terracidiphilus sp.]|jgi:type VI secretion system protein ImpJ